MLKEFNYTGLDVLPLSEHINKQPILYAWSSACSGYTMLVIDMVQIW